MPLCVTPLQIFSAPHRSEASGEVETIKKSQEGFFFFYLEIDLIPLSKEG